jgi:hypothetical protein
MFIGLRAITRMEAAMIFDRLDNKSAAYRWSAAQGEPLSRRSSYLVIVIGSILGWAVFISAGAALLRLAGLRRLGFDEIRLAGGG